MIKHKRGMAHKGVLISIVVVLGLFGIGVMKSVVENRDKDPTGPESVLPLYKTISTLSCPGFNKYGGVIRLLRIDTNDAIWYDDDTQRGLLSLYLEITDGIDIYPIAIGNTCRYVFTKNHDRIITQKAPCASLCRGYLMENGGSNYEFSTK